MAWHPFMNNARKCIRSLQHSLTKHDIAKTSFLPRAFHVFATNKMAADRLDVSGIFPPIPTPFKENEDIDYEKLKENLDKWNKVPFAGNFSEF